MDTLTLSDISFAYPAGGAGDRSQSRVRMARRVDAARRTPDVLQELALGVPDGEVTAILGPNGAGKTTALNICLGWLKPRSGQVRFRGQPLGSYSRRDLGREISLVPQSEHIPFAYTLLEYVLLGRAPYLAPLETPGRDDVDLACRMLERVGMRDRAESTILATSAGEKQLVMLARSLVQEPSFLLLDEPSAHLDLANKRRLIELIHAEVEAGMTVLLTAHEPEFAAAVASHVILMRDGRVMTAGPAEEVMTGEHLSATYDIPIEVHHTAGRPTFHW